MSMIIMMIAIFAIMWFFMIKPQQKKQKEIQKFQNELTEGTQVITGGGPLTSGVMDPEALTIAAKARSDRV